MFKLEYSGPLTHHIQPHCVSDILLLRNFGGHPGVGLIHMAASDVFMIHDRLIIT
jgi:hypothetical protein